MSNLITIAMTIGLSSWLFMGGEEGEGINIPEVPSLTKAVASVTGSKEPKVSNTSSKSLAAMSNYELVATLAKQAGLPPAIALAVCKQESWNCTHIRNGKLVVSSAKAFGAMQLIKTTFELYKPKGGKIENRYDNIYAGVHLLKHLHTKYSGNVALMAAEYNAGSTAVEKYHGIPRYRETQTYCRNVVKFYKEFTQLEQSRG